MLKKLSIASSHVYYIRIHFTRQRVIQINKCHHIPNMLQPHNGICFSFDHEECETPSDRAIFPRLTAIIRFQCVIPEDVAALNAKTSILFVQHEFMCRHFHSTTKRAYHTPITANTQNDTALGTSATRHSIPSACLVSASNAPQMNCLRIASIST